MRSTHSGNLNVQTQSKRIALILLSGFVFCSSVCYGQALRRHSSEYVHRATNSRQDFSRLDKDIAERVYEARRPSRQIRTRASSSARQAIVLQRLPNSAIGIGDEMPSTGEDARHLVRGKTSDPLKRSGSFQIRSPQGTTDFPSLAARSNSNATDSTDDDLLVDDTDNLLIDDEDDLLVDDDESSDDLLVEDNDDLRVDQRDSGRPLTGEHIRLLPPRTPRNNVETMTTQQEAQDDAEIDAEEIEVDHAKSEEGSDTEASDSSTLKNSGSNVEFDPNKCLPGAAEYDPLAFGDDPDYSHMEYNPAVETDIYTGKFLNPTERPWIELGRGNYLYGEIPPSDTWLGRHNLISQHFLLYGDYRAGMAYNDNKGVDNVTWAHRLNLDLDWKLTATERIHAFIGPLDRGAAFTNTQYNNNEFTFNEEFDDDFDTIYFEGDFGSLVGGAFDIDPPFDLPFATGLVPLLFQNGVWINDAIVGGIVTMPAKYVGPLNWTNYDLAFFFGFNEIDSPAFPADDSVADVFGAHAAIDAFDGYLEIGYAFLHDEDIPERSYHNIGVSFSKRYFHLVSNAMRVIINTGQDDFNGQKTADGQLVFLENALISSDPNFLVPYLNLWAGFGSPQGVARAVGGNLQNIGINFETDGLTGFPLLDDTGNNTFGGALGVNILAEDFAEQLIVEFAWVNVRDEAFNRKAVSDQYGFQVRYQRPITNAWIFRCDAMHGIFREDEDVTGIRTEFRYKF